MPDPLVSVIVPTYNVETYLRDCIRSVQQQSYASLEIIIVDDGSTDAGAAIAQTLADGDDRITIVRQKNRGPGPGGGRNGGLSSATGELIMFVDADDMLAPDCIGRLVEATCADGKGNDMATIGVAYLGDGGSWPSAIHEHSHARSQNRVVLASSPALAADTTPWNKLFRREFFDRVVGQWPEGVLYEDTEPMTRCHIASSGTGVVASIGYYWRLRSTGTSITQQRGSLAPIRAQMQATRAALDQLRTANDRAFAQLSWRIISIDLAWMIRQLWGFRGEQRREFVGLLRTALADADPDASSAVNRRLARAYGLLETGPTAAFAAWLVANRMQLFPDGRSFDEARTFQDPLWTLKRSERVRAGLLLEVAGVSSRQAELILRPSGADADPRRVGPNRSGQLVIPTRNHVPTEASTWFVDLVDHDDPRRRGPIRRSSRHALQTKIRSQPRPEGAVTWCDGRLVVKLGAG